MTDNVATRLRRLWTIDDVAAFARVSRRTVDRRIADGTLPVVRLGGVVRFEPRAVLTALRQADIDGG